MRPPSEISGDGLCTGHGAARKLDANQPGIDDDFVVSSLGGVGFRAVLVLRAKCGILRGAEKDKSTYNSTNGVDQ